MDREVHTIHWEAVDFVRWDGPECLHRLHPQGISQGHGVAARAPLTVWGADDDLAEPGRDRRQHSEAGRMDAVVVGQ